MAIDVPRLDPLPAFNFYIVLIDASSVASTLFTAATGIALGGFSECSGLESTLEVDEFILRFLRVIDHNRIQDEKAEIAEVEAEIVGTKNLTVHLDAVW